MKTSFTHNGHKFEPELHGKAEIMWRIYSLKNRVWYYQYKFFMPVYSTRTQVINKSGI